MQPDYADEPQLQGKVMKTLQSGRTEMEVLSKVQQSPSLMPDQEDVLDDFIQRTNGMQEDDDEQQFLYQATGKY